MTDKITKGYELDLSVNDKGFSAGTSKAAKSSEKLADGIEKVEKSADKAFKKKLPGAAKSSKKAFGELSKSAETLREKIEKAGKTQTAKQFNKLEADMKRLQRRMNSMARDAGPGFARIRKGASSARPNVLSLRNAVNQLSGSFLALGSSASAGIAIKELISNSLELERAAAEVATIVDTTRVPIEQITQDVRSMAAAFGIDGVQSTKALYQAISAGVKPAQALSVLGDATKLATAGLATLDESVDLITSTLNSYGLSADKAAAVSDVFFQTVKEGKTTIPELAASIGKIAPIAANAGVSVIELGAGIATLTATGLSTAEAVTGLQQVIKAFLKPSGEARKAAEELGFDLSATALKTKGLQGVMTELRTALQKAGERGENTSEIMQKLIGRTEGANAAVSLATTGFQKFGTSLDNVKNSLNSVNEASDKVADTVGVKLSAAWENSKQQGSKFGDELLSIGDKLIDLVGGAENFGLAVQSLGNSLLIVPSLAKATVFSLGRFIASLYEWIRTVGRLAINGATTIVSALKKALSGDLKGAYKDMTNVIGEQIDIMSQFSASASKNFNDSVSDFMDARKRIEQNFSNFGTVGSSLLGFEKEKNRFRFAKSRNSIEEDLDRRSLFGAPNVAGISSSVARGVFDGFSRAFGQGSGASQPGADNGFLGSLGSFVSGASSLAGSALSGLTPGVAQSLLDSQEADQYYRELDAMEEASNQRLIEERQRAQRLLIENELGYQQRYSSIIENGALNSQSTLRDSLIIAFEEGIEGAEPSFTRALTRTLSASAQAGITFRGSSLQAGQGTRQQLQDSLFNRQATGRQIATNIQLLAAGFSSGGTVPGVDRGRDSVLAPLRPGEEVIRPEAARPNRDLLKAINRSRGPIVLPRRSEQVVFPGQASGDRITNNSASNSSSVVNNSAVTNNRSSVNVRGGINVSVPGVDPKSIANAVVREIQYKMRRGSLNGGAL